MYGFSTQLKSPFDSVVTQATFFTANENNGPAIRGERPECSVAPSTDRQSTMSTDHRPPHGSFITETRHKAERACRHCGAPISSVPYVREHDEYGCESCFLAARGSAYRH